MGVAAALLGMSVVPSIAWNGGNRGGTPRVSTASVAVGNLNVDAARITFSNNAGGRFSGNIRNGGGSVGRPGFDGRNRFNGNRGGNNVVVVTPDNSGFWNWNNSNYLGLPPWYRLNYYTPWMSDYENGTAYQNIPTSHASLGYGVPEDYPGANSYTGPSYQTAGAVSGPAVNQANVDFVVAVQRELRRRGFYRGVVNGISDAETRSAIRAYEVSAGLPVTGVIGVPLLRTLGFF